jgi:hypothetical protein
LNWVKYLNPAEIEFFKNVFYDFEAPGKLKSTARWGSGFPTCLRNRRFIGPMVKNAFDKTRIWLGSSFNDYRSLVVKSAKAGLREQEARRK